jgi:hypothetical protein
MQEGAQQVMESRPMTERDLTALRSAVAALEHPSLAARLGNMIGKPIELIGAALPASAAQAISAATSKALEIALQVALRTMQGTRPSLSQRFHKLLATASGAAGGALGLASLPIELPVSTVIMLRSIAEIARSEGEDLSDPEAALSCMQVFALGGRASSDDVSESGYFVVPRPFASLPARSQIARLVTRSLPAWREPFRSSAGWAALRSTMHSSSTSRGWRGPTLRCVGSSASTAPKSCDRSTSGSHSHIKDSRSHADGYLTVLAKCRLRPGYEGLGEFEHSDRGARRPIPQLGRLRFDPQQAYIGIRGSAGPPRRIG